jgi:lysozyme
MKPSVNCINLIKHFESCLKKLPDGRFAAYPDSGYGWDLPTIGWGSTVNRDTMNKVKRDEIIDQATADRWLVAEIEEKSKALNATLGSVVVTQDMYDALVSFAYNYGNAGVAKSKTMAYLKAGEKDAAAQAFMNIVHDGSGATVPGLVRRRNAERCLFLGNYADAEKYCESRVKFTHSTGEVVDNKPNVVGWYEARLFVSNTEPWQIGIIAKKDNSDDSLALTKIPVQMDFVNEFMAKNGGKFSTVLARADKPWPGDVTPPKPAVNLSEKVMQLAESEAKKGIEWTSMTCEAEKYLAPWRRELGAPSGRYAWCSAFCCWCLTNAGIKIDFTPDKEPGFTLAYVPTFKHWAQQEGVFITKNPRRGDIVIFGEPGKDPIHIGFVSEIKDGRIFTCEGNSNNRTVYHQDRTGYNIQGFVRIFNDDGSLKETPGLYT